MRRGVPNLVGVLLLVVGLTAAPAAADLNRGSGADLSDRSVRGELPDHSSDSDSPDRSTDSDVPDQPIGADRLAYPTGAGPAAVTPTTGLATADIDAEESAAGTQTTTGSNIRLTQRLGLVPDRPGIYEASHRYRVPDHLRSLEVTLPEGATVVSVRGFRNREGRTYEWDGSTTTPRIDYRVPANRSIDQTGPIAGPGRLTFVDVGEWALVSQPQTSHSWGWIQGGGEVGFERSMTAERGATGDEIAYLGDYEAHTATAHGQEFRLIVPERATLEEPPTEVLTAMANASDRLRVGDRDETVFAVAAPTPDGIKWGVRGLQTGDADMWVRDFERLDEANNVWLHEYVHTRQSYTTANDARWITEGSAVYYAALLSLSDGRIQYPAFRKRLAFGDATYGGSVLAQPETWKGNANYHVGALVAGELDRQLRIATDGTTSLQEVFRRMNAQRGTVTASELGALLRAAGGSDVDQLGQRYTTTTERPTAWNAEQHRDAFGGDSLPVRITYALADGGEGVRVDGPYRTRALDAGDTGEVTLVPGERLAVDVVARNDGESGGEYDAVLRIDDEPQATQSGRLDPGESTTLTFERRFGTSGRHTVSVGGATLRVTVREPATPGVTGLSVDRTEIVAGETATVAVDLRNDAAYPGLLELPITRDGAVVDTRTVRLDAGSRTTVTTGIRFDEPGTYVVGVGNASGEAAVVTVVEESPTARDTQTGTGTPGFGAVAAVVAIGVWIVVRRRM